MLNKLFPYRLHLQIFQLDEYSPKKLVEWVTNHFLQRTIENKKPFVLTQKAKTLYYLSQLLAILIVILATFYFKIAGFIFGMLIATQPFLFLILASYLLLPFENAQKNKIKAETQKKIASFSKLKVIGITGSYGKTSVKEFLYQILRTEHQVLRTPESYNTPYGIAKVVDLELDDSYEYFICEMGAYRIGEIKEICDMVHPRFGILTGINEQHLKTFGSLENTTKGKFELIDSLPENGFGLVNINNELIKDEYEKHIENKKIYTYSYEKQFDFNDEGTQFKLFLDDKLHTAKTKLLGKANVENITAAATMASRLGMKTQKILKTVEELKPIPHRTEFKPQKDMIIIDDAYNSNYDGFLNAIEVLVMYKMLDFNRTKILVTPGIVDLGSETLRIHKKLGEEISKIERINYVILVGKSDRTKGLKEGIEDKKKIIEIDSIRDVWTTIKELEVKHPIVLLENDLPDNY